MIRKAKAADASKKVYFAVFVVLLLIYTVALTGCSKGYKDGGKWDHMCYVHACVVEIIDDHTMKVKINSEELRKDYYNDIFFDKEVILDCSIGSVDQEIREGDNIKFSFLYGEIEIKGNTTYVTVSNVVLQYN